mmetsp:Transcript_27661/g.64926  ORF Transcript_27661/g.64926 Transcript_27661/m.64926 type:complete len:255 (-) Transcript_27661:101-865(-)
MERRPKRPLFECSPKRKEKKNEIERSALRNTRVPKQFCVQSPTAHCVGHIRPLHCIALEKRHGHQDQEGDTVQDQLHRVFRPHSVQTVQTVSPRHGHQKPRKELVNLADRLVRLVDSKVGMQKDAPGQEGTHHGHHQSDSDLAVHRGEVGALVQVLVVVYGVQTPQRQEKTQAGNHPVQLGVGVASQFLGHRGDSHRPRHSQCHQKGMPRKGRLPFSLGAGGNVPTGKDRVRQKGSDQQPVGRWRGRFALRRRH